jgi:carbon starvation protein
MFGVANQLLAVVALAVGTTVLLKMGRVRYVWTTAVPMAFMIVTTTAAGLLNIFAPWGFLSEKFIQKYGATFAYIDVGLTVLLLGCVAGVLITSAIRWRELLRTGGSQDPEASVVLPDAVPAAS